MNLAVELILMYIIDEMGGKVTFKELLYRTDMAPRVLKKYLWYCQRKKFLRRDIGIYYLTELGRSILGKNAIVSFNGKIYAIKLADKIHLITLGKKMRMRSVDVESVRRLLATNCISKTVFKSLEMRDSLADTVRLLKLLGVVRYRGEKICFEIKNIKNMRILGIL